MPVMLDVRVKEGVRVWTAESVSEPVRVRLNVREKVTPSVIVWRVSECVAEKLSTTVRETLWGVSVAACVPDKETVMCACESVADTVCVSGTVSSTV